MVSYLKVGIAIKCESESPVFNSYSAAHLVDSRKKKFTLAMSNYNFNQLFPYFRDFFVCMLLTAFVAITINFIVHKWRFVKLALKLPGPRAYPIVGNALKFACQSDQLLERIVEVVTPYVNATPMRLWMGPTLYVIITEPRDIEIILNSQQAANKGSAYKFLRPFIGDGLISGSGKLWKSHRKIISHIVNQKILNEFVEAFDRHSKHLVNKLECLANKEEFDILNYMEGCTIDIVSETVMGYENLNALNNPNQEFVHYTAEMYKIVHDRMMKIWLYPDWIFRFTSNYTKQQQAQKIIRNFTERCIEERRKHLEENNKTSILQRLLDVNSDANDMDDEQLRDEIYTVYIASQDTLAVISSFAILMVGIHESVQDKARAEVNEVLSDGHISIKCLSKLKYLEMVIKETLRLFPIAPLMVRQLSGEIKLDHCILPKNCQIVIASFITHRSPKYWENPEKFVPERFELEKNSERHPCTFIPFSGGPMGCIGQKYAIMSLKIILANILQKYIIKSKVAFKDIKLRTDISIRSAEGYKISLQLANNI